MAVLFSASSCDERGGPSDARLAAQAAAQASDERAEELLDAARPHPRPTAELCQHVLSRFSNEGREAPFDMPTCVKAFDAWRKDKETSVNDHPGSDLVAELKVSNWSECIIAADTLADLDRCTEEERPTAAIEVSVEELLKAYRGNEVAADRKYMGRPLKVSGALDTVRKSMGDVFMVLKPQGRRRPSIERVECKVPPANIDTVAELQPGELLRVEGCVSGYLGGAVFMEECP